MKNYSYSLLLTQLFILLYFCAKTQVPIVETNFNWQNCFEINYFHGGFVSANNGFYLISRSNGLDSTAHNYHGGSDILLIHTDSTGNILWKKCFGGSKLEVGRTLISSLDGNIFLIGRAESDDGDIKSKKWDGPGAWVVKINYQGDIIWEKAFGTATGFGMTIRSYVALPDGGIMVSSVIQGKSGDISTFYGGLDIWTVRLSSQGEMLWEKTFGNIGLYENLHSMIKTNDGNIMCAASASIGAGMVECTLPASEVGNAWLYEIDLQGNILWQQCYGGENHDIPDCIVQSNNGFTVAASSLSWGGDIVNQHGSIDIWLFETDHNGNILWSNCLGGSLSEYPRYIFLLSDGGYMVVGYADSVDGDLASTQTYYHRNLWFIKINSQGIAQWQRTIPSLEDLDNWYSPFVIQKDDNTYVVAQGIEARGPDIICNGNPSDDNPYVWLFEVEFTDQFVSVNELHGQVLNVSPNPAKDLMMFELPAIGELCIYSVSGRLLHKAQCLAGDYHYNCGHLSSGVYFYTFMMDEALLHGKVVVE